MLFQDEWDHDPSIQMLRRIFSQMEKAQQGLLRDLNISLFDQRLRCSRENARNLFERIWPSAIRKGVAISEEDAVSLYIHCLAHALSLNGIKVPGKALQKDERIAKFFREEL